MEVIGFNQADAEKIVELIDRTGVNFGYSAEKPQDGPRLVIVNSAAGLTARSGTTLGTGTGVVQKISSAGVLSDWTAPGGGTLTITVKNSSTTALAAGYIQAKKEGFSGVWLADVGECA